MQNQYGRATMMKWEEELGERENEIGENEDKVGGGVDEAGDLVDCLRHGGHRPGAGHWSALSRPKEPFLPGPGMVSFLFSLVDPT